MDTGAGSGKTTGLARRTGLKGPACGKNPAASGGNVREHGAVHLGGDSRPRTVEKEEYGLVLFDLYSLLWLVGVFQRYIRYEYNTFQVAVSVFSTILTATHMNKRHREFKGGW